MLFRSSVGTVWFPRLTDITNSAAAGSLSMSTSVYGMSSAAKAVFDAEPDVRDRVRWLPLGDAVELAE